MSVCISGEKQLALHPMLNHHILILNTCVHLLSEPVCEAAALSPVSQVSTGPHSLPQLRSYHSGLVRQCGQFLFGFISILTPGMSNCRTMTHSKLLKNGPGVIEVLLLTKML